MVEKDPVHRTFPTAALNCPAVPALPAFHKGTPAVTKLASDFISLKNIAQHHIYQGKSSGYQKTSHECVYKQVMLLQDHEFYKLFSKSAVLLTHLKIPEQ